jgi:hypothetical protein
MVRLLALLALAWFLVGCAESGPRPAAPPVAPPPPVPAPPPAPEVAPAPPPAEKVDAFAHALTVDPLKSLPADGRVTLRLRVRNPTGREVRTSVSWEATGTSWFGQKAVTGAIAPGGEGTVEIQARIGRRLFPLPQARLELVDGPNKLCGWPFLPQAVCGLAPRVMAWNVIGPFDLGMTDSTDAERDDINRYLKASPPGWAGALPPEKTVDLAAAYAGKDGRPVRWQPAQAGAEGVVDLAALYKTDYAVACAAAYVHCAKAGTYAFTAGSDDSLLVRINGREVWKKHAQRPVRPDEDVFQADLKEGWNEVFLKVANRVEGWGFCLRLVDPEGLLKFALRPTGD